jgi:hypothetical protein
MSMKRTLLPSSKPHQKLFTAFGKPIDVLRPHKWTVRLQVMLVDLNTG